MIMLCCHRFLTPCMKWEINTEKISCSKNALDWRWFCLFNQQRIPSSGKRLLETSLFQWTRAWARSPSIFQRVTGPALWVISISPYHIKYTVKWSYSLLSKNHSQFVNLFYSIIKLHLLIEHPKSYHVKTSMFNHKKSICYENLYITVFYFFNVIHKCKKSFQS